MINVILKYTIMFVSLVLIQVLVLNNIQLSGFVNPFLYVLFILLLPVQTPGYLLLMTSFVLGLSIDMFSNTPGIHASASVFMAFLRPGVINLISIRDMYEKGNQPRVATYGFSWFLKYTTILVLFHHLFLFFMEAFTFSGFIFTLTRSLLSTLFTIILIVMSQFIVFRR